MKLYSKAQLEPLALRKWGGAEGLAAEQRRREERRTARAATAAAALGAVPAAPPGGCPSPGAGTGGDMAAAGGGIATTSAVNGGVPRWLQLPPLLLERVRVLTHMQVPEHLQQHQQQSMQQEQAVLEVHGGVSVLDGAGPREGRQQGEAEAAADAALSDDDNVMLIGSSSGEEEEQERTARGQQHHAGHQEQQQQRQQQQGGGQCGAVKDADGFHGIEDEVIVISSDDEAEVGVGLQGGAGGLGSPGGQGQGTGGGEAVEATGAAAGGAEAVEAAERAVGSRSACAHSGLQQHGTAVAAAAAAAAGVCGTGAAFASDAGPAAKCSHESGTGGRYVLYWMQTAVRGHENPALDAARAAAAALRLPLRCAAVVLPYSHAHATHRRIKFQLEGLHDAQAELRALGLHLDVGLDLDPQRLGQATPAAGGGGAAAANPQHATGAPGPTLLQQLGLEVAPGLQYGGVGHEGEAVEVEEEGKEEKLQQRGAGWRALVELARGAALVVTEDMPVDPEAAWLAALRAELQAADQQQAQQQPQQQGGAGISTGGGCHVPGLWAVDTACVVPMRLVARAHDKAYAYRSATEGLRKQRLRQLYATPGFVSSLPTANRQAPTAGTLEPMELDHQHGTQNGAATGGVGAGNSCTAKGSSGGGGGGSFGGIGGVLVWADLTRSGLNLGQLAAAVRGVDLEVSGVDHMLGGSTAGYGRWEGWRRGGGLQRYAAQRNDALQRGGTSRMSAYLRWGMVSPFRIAREAGASGGSGSYKYLDELITWRELSYSFAFHKYAQLESLAVLPRWAQDTLAAHAADPRVVKTQEQLEHGTTGDAFWDAAQQQLVRTGELHNNVRMTWGKALLGWTSSPQEALRTAIHLNHRFALDGCDPASYGGILWCFGLFDGPKDPQTTPVSGSIRRRPTAGHARRLDPSAYAVLPP